jgi:ABC-type dipeptide/oligopeptide/nickel transport system permease subunit
MKIKSIKFMEDVKVRNYLGNIYYVGRLLWRDRGGMLGLSLFLILVVSAFFSPLIAPHNPSDMQLHLSRTPPFWVSGGSLEYPLGTDNLGQDLLSRLIYGSRVSLTVGFFGVLIACSIGLIFGLIAGYLGGRIDGFIMNIVNLVLSLPYLLIVVVIAAIAGRSLINVILIFGITDSPSFIRLVRGEVLQIRQSNYVESAVAMGVRPFRILFYHIMPNLVGPVITLATIEMSNMIFYEAGLGFLGLSVPPSVPSWGNMLSNGRQYLTSHPWIAIYPGLAIMVTALGMNLLGDWLRDVLDPRLRRVRR